MFESVGFSTYQFVVTAKKRTKMATTMKMFFIIGGKNEVFLSEGQIIDCFRKLILSTITHFMN